ncbi:unnamed protein product [Spirodela intermedia]|uniref:Transcription factor MYC/MYB N-terminal domain-containing protein n=1 Tax=Spirodela intermedia TaxID=51605 RepID=A0A7I8LCI0_SPIIN|nr:unnamed protein product [Spirodela intermedia]
MEEHLNPFAVTHLLQHTLRSLCVQEDSQWVYAVFWRILPRNYPPPKWDLQGDGALDRSRGNRRNWILAWEDGFCNFSASTVDCAGSSAGEGNVHGLQPELFFKMSHEIYNYGEGFVGKVAADRSHKWVFNDPQEREISLLSAWHNPVDSHPRTWEAQFQAGIKTIVLIAVREGVIQLGAINKVMEDPSYVLLLRNRFSYLESIPGVLLPHPSSAAVPSTGDLCETPESWAACYEVSSPVPPMHHHIAHHQVGISPSMSSLEALLSKLPSVNPPPPAPQLQPPCLGVASLLSPPQWPTPKEELGDNEYGGIAGPAAMGGHGMLSSLSGYYVQASQPGQGY